MVEVAGNIVEQSISILIDPGPTHSFITPRVVEICAFKKVKHRKSWLVQLATIRVNLELRSSQRWLGLAHGLL